MDCADAAAAARRDSIRISILSARRKAKNNSSKHSTVRIVPKEYITNRRRRRRRIRMQTVTYSRVRGILKSSACTRVCSASTNKLIVYGKSDASSPKFVLTTTAWNSETLARVSHAGL